MKLISIFSSEPNKPRKKRRAQKSARASSGGVSNLMLRIIVSFGVALAFSGCSVPKTHVAGGPYCVVLYAGYSFRPARLLGQSREEAEKILESGHPIGITFVSANGLVERSRQCWKSKCSDWLVYEYDSTGRLTETRNEAATEPVFDPAKCPAKPPQAMVRLPMLEN